MFFFFTDPAVAKAYELIGSTTEWKSPLCLVIEFMNNIMMFIADDGLGTNSHSEMCHSALFSVGAVCGYVGEQVRCNLQD